MERVIELSCGTSIRDAYIEIVTESEGTNDIIVADFNGHKITSEMTLDEVYIEICGKTEREYRDAEKKHAEEYEEREKKYMDSVPYLITEYTEKAKERIKPEDMDEFIVVLPTLLKSIYHTYVVDSLFRLIDILNEGDLDKAKQVFEDQGHSGNTAHATIRLLMRFHKDGNKFRDIVL